MLGRDDKVSALFVIVGAASNVAHERDDIDGDDGTGTFCDEGVVKAQGTPGDVVHDLKVQIFQGGQIFFKEDGDEDYGYRGDSASGPV